MLKPFPVPPRQQQSSDATPSEASRPPSGASDATPPPWATAASRGLEETRAALLATDALQDVPEDVLFLIADFSPLALDWGPEKNLAAGPTVVTHEGTRLTVDRTSAQWVSPSSSVGRLSWHQTLVLLIPIPVGACFEVTVRPHRNETPGQKGLPYYFFGFVNSCHADDLTQWLGSDRARVQSWVFAPYPKLFEVRRNQDVLGESVYDHGFREWMHIRLRCDRRPRHERQARPLVPKTLGAAVAVPEYKVPSDDSGEIKAWADDHPLPWPQKSGPFPISASLDDAPLYFALSMAVDHSAVTIESAEFL